MSFTAVQAFSSASKEYNGNAGLQEQAADWLCEALSRVHRLLDVGCGTGLLAQRLNNEQLAGELLGLDMAWGMLQQSRVSYAHVLCGDMECLPFADDSVDGVVSNLAVQWSVNPERTLLEMRRVLRSDGYLVLTVPLPGSLAELEWSWQQQGDAHRHINQFDSVADWRLRVDKVFAGAVEIDLQQRQFVRWFDTPKQAVRSLKGVGANRVTQGARQGLTGKQAYADMLKSYESLRQARGIPLTYEILRLKIVL